MPVLAPVTSTAFCGAGAVRRLSNRRAIAIAARVMARSFIDTSGAARDVMAASSPARNENVENRLTSGNRNPTSSPLRSSDEIPYPRKRGDVAIVGLAMIQRVRRAGIEHAEQALRPLRSDRREFVVVRLPRSGERSDWRTSSNAPSGTQHWIVS